MALRIITALFDDVDEAAKEIDRIEAEGVPHADIAIVASHEEGYHAQRGGVRVAVRADGEKADRVTRLLGRRGSIDLDAHGLDAHGQGWDQRGWTGGTARVIGHGVGPAADALEAGAPIVALDPTTAPPTRMSPEEVH